jgi:hypothetical protein
MAQTRLEAQCDELLKQGIYNVRDTHISVRTAKAYANWFCSEKFSSANEANEFGGSLGLPFDGLPLKLGFNQSSSSFSSWYESFCQDVRTNFQQSTKVEEHLKEVSSRLLDSFDKCIAAKGLHVWLEYTYSPKFFHFCANWVTPSSTAPRRLKFESFLPPEGVSCKPDPRKISIGPSVFTARCSRTDDAVDLVVNAEYLVAEGDLMLPAIESSVRQPEPCPAGLVRTTTNPLIHQESAERVYGQLSDDRTKVLMMRVRSAPEQLDWEPLDKPCEAPNWTPNAVWTDPRRSSPFFEVVYGLDCGDTVYLLRFWNLPNEKPVGKLASTSLTESPSRDCDGWNPNPTPGSQTSPFFEYTWLLRHGTRSYHLRFTNAVGRDNITILPE